MIPVLAKKYGSEEIDLALALPDLLSKNPKERVEWVTKVFPRQAILTTSFGAQSAAFLHLVSQVIPEIPVVFIDTGYHFPETLSFSQTLVQKLNLNLKTYRPLLSPKQIESRHGR